MPLVKTIKRNTYNNMTLSQRIGWFEFREIWDSIEPNRMSFETHGACSRLFSAIISFNTVRNDSKRPATVSLNTLSVFDNALTMFWKWIWKWIWKWFWNGFATHFGSIEKHCQCFKTHWKCSSIHFQCVENALQQRSASTLIFLFPNRVTFGMFWLVPIIANRPAVQCNWFWG